MTSGLLYIVVLAILGPKTRWHIYVILEFLKEIEKLFVLEICSLSNVSFWGILWPSTSMYIVRLIKGANTLQHFLFPLHQKLISLFVPDRVSPRDPYVWSMQCYARKSPEIIYFRYIFNTLPIKKVQQQFSPLKFSSAFDYFHLKGAMNPIISLKR